MSKRGTEMGTEMGEGTTDVAFAAIIAPNVIETPVHEATRARIATRRRPSDSSGRGDERLRPRLDGRERDRDLLRRRFFADAGWIAARYRIGPDDVVRHVETARRSIPRRTNHGFHTIDDVVIAAACCRGVSLAWADLATHVEPVLRRAAATRLGDSDAAAFAAIFWEALRSRTLGGDREGAALAQVPSLGEFAGQRPLADWLSDRLLARLDWASAEAPAALRVEARRAAT